MIAALMSAKSRAGLCGETLQGQWGYPGQTQSSFTNINGTLSGALKGGRFLQGHFKLSTLQQGGDTGSAPRELWVRMNRKWFEVVIKAIWLHWMTSSCSPLLQSSLPQLSLHLGLVFRSISTSPFCTVFLCLLTFLSLTWSHRAAQGLNSMDTPLRTTSPPSSNQRNRKLPWNKNKQTKRWVIQRFGPFSSSALCSVSPSTFCISFNPENTWLNAALSNLVERVLVLYCSGPASPISVVVVLRRTTRGFQQAFRAVASAL